MSHCQIPQVLKYAIRAMRHCIGGGTLEDVMCRFFHVGASWANRGRCTTLFMEKCPGGDPAM